MKDKIAFLDRDGVLIFEPKNTFQVDRLDLLEILPGVIESLKDLMSRGFKLVLVSNQDGLGTESFPREAFDGPQNKMLEIFKDNGVSFEATCICPHFPTENCDCRKPKLGIVEEFLKNHDVDLENSFMYGDRETDRRFAQNLGIRFIKTETNQTCSLTQLL